MYSVREIHSAAHAALQSHSNGSDKLTLNERNRLNTTLSYPARRPGTSPYISILSNTLRRAASESISLRNMYSIREIHSAARTVLESQSDGSDKLETIDQNKGPYIYRTVAHNRVDRRNKKPALSCLLQSRSIGLCPQRPVRSAVYS